MDQFYDQLVASGKLRAAEIYKATAAKSGKAVAAVVAVSNPSGQMMKVFCAKTSCRNFTMQIKGKGQRYVCADHDLTTAIVAGPVEQIRYKGRVYTPHYIGEDGIAFRLKNGEARTLEPSRVEWVK